MTQLQKIVAKAKSLKKSHPNTKWTDLIKKASKLVTPAKKSVSGIKKTVVKKSAPIKPLIKKRIETKSDFAMAGVKKYVPVRHGEVTTRDINEFVDYCNDYYGKKGFYKDELNGGYTKAEIKKAVLKYIDNLESSQTWGYGDTLDRERVRDILMNNGIGKLKKKKAVGYKEDRIWQLKKATPYIRKYKAKGYSRKDAIKQANIDSTFMSGTKTHKDTKSHNVRISVMSGINKTTLSKIDWYLKHIASNEKMIEILKNRISNSKQREFKIDARKSIINLRKVNADYKKMITALKKHIK